MTEPKKCPRCLGMIPSNENPGAHYGALSRRDNKTEICSECGTEEAVADLLQIGDDKERWPLRTLRARPD